MPSISRPPHPALRPFVKTVWATDWGQPIAAAGCTLEHVLPTGLMHLVFRLSPSVLRIYDASGVHDHTLSRALVGGARSRFYAREVARASRSIGAQLHCGAAFPLFGISAAELSERHTALDELWGSEAAGVHDALVNAPSVQSALQQFEAALLRRLPSTNTPHAAIAQAVIALAAGPRPIALLVEASGISHRVFIERFRNAVGLTPKTFSRVARFQTARAALIGPSATLVSVASLAGYADQAHFTRDFRQLAGVSPSQLRRAGGSNHVPIGPDASLLRAAPEG